MDLITRKKNTMTNSLLKFTLPSILFIITALTGLIKYFFYPTFLTTEELLICVFNFCFFVAIGLLINKNYNWTKYLVLVLAVFGLLNFPSVTLNLVPVIFVIQRLLLIIAAILLFKPLMSKKI